MIYGHEPSVLKAAGIVYLAGTIPRYVGKTEGASMTRPALQRLFARDLKCRVRCHHQGPREEPPLHAEYRIDNAVVRFLECRARQASHRRNSACHFPPLRTVTWWIHATSAFHVQPIPANFNAGHDGPAGDHNQSDPDPERWRLFHGQLKADFCAMEATHAD